MERETMRTWAEIDLGALRYNYEMLRGLIPADCKYLAVVKANAYGHGAVSVARELEKLGADYLGVACLPEAAELRAAGIRAPILILGGTPAEFADELLRLDVTQTVYDPATAAAYGAAALRQGKKLKVHVKVDTGMSRLGLLAADPETPEAIAALRSLPGLDPEGIFMHFANADGSEEYTMLQFTRFLDLLDTLEGKYGMKFPIRHCAASAAMIKYPCTHLDMVRPGIVQYGCYPSPDAGMEELVSLRPVMTLKTRIASVKTLPAGTSVSYGCTRVLTRESRVAVLPAGYADGLHRVASDRLPVLVNGMPAVVLGRICMDMCMADVTDIPGVRAGDEAEIFGAALPVEAYARLAGTISYELLCAVAPRVPRVCR